MQSLTGGELIFTYFVVRNSDWRECVANVNDFSDREKLLLSEHFGFYWALYNDERPAETAAQREFIENCYQGVPRNEHEEAFYKFLEKTGNVEGSPLDEGEVILGAGSEAPVPSCSVDDASVGGLKEPGGTGIDSDEAESSKGLINNEFHPIRGPASVDDILGGVDGKPPAVLAPKVALDGFGARKDWDRMRGRRKRQD